MSRLSPASLLIVGAFMVPLFIELPVVLSFVGVNLPMEVSLGMGVVAFAMVLVWSEVSEKPEAADA
ncbi:CbaC protein [Halorientalis pallida]|uniref:CbaC protein n=1 Tax=Halorientalis pallida TaxID=2479928 RepID=A0A498KVB5_9EURY|nr:CbaC protein [Halorientalis pallida]RXK49137.1 CbaC protein [Halorientalis pallida]